MLFIKRYYHYLYTLYWYNESDSSFAVKLSRRVTSYLTNGLSHLSCYVHLKHTKSQAKTFVFVSTNSFRGQFSTDAHQTSRAARNDQTRDSGDRNQRGEYNSDCVYVRISRGSEKLNQPACPNIVCSTLAALRGFWSAINLSSLSTSYIPSLLFGEKYIPRDATHLSSSLFIYIDRLISCSCIRRRIGYELTINLHRDYRKKRS